jgi:hypothetical protein
VARTARGPLFDATATHADWRQHNRVEKTLLNQHVSHTARKISAPFGRAQERVFCHIAIAVEQVEVNNTMPRDVRCIARISPIRLTEYEDNRRAALRDLCSRDTNAIASIVEATAIQINVLVGVNDGEKYAAPWALESI